MYYCTNLNLLNISEKILKTSSTNCLQLINIKRKEMNSQNDVHVFEIYKPN